MEYIDHIISHCTFHKSTYVDVDYSNGYIVDETAEEADDYNLETHGKGKKRPKSRIPKPKCCNKCSFVAKTKLALWLHLRQHFVQEEYTGFVCTLCPFATTLKHHITFHWFSNHDDFKGYMCTECRYTCVSKSMLTSHMKTHSQVYQYNCGSCKYRTKFCNAMKKHLKDNQHVPGTVLNPDGTPNPFATIDVYGNKRGPRRKQLVEEKTSEATEIIEDRPSTSGLNALVSMVPTSPASSASISSMGSPSSKMTTSPVWKSPIKISCVRTLSTSPQSPSNSLITNIQTELSRMSNENEMNPSISSSTNEQISSALTDPMFAALCRLLFENIEEHSKDEERRNALRLLQIAKKYLVGSGYVEHVASATGANGYLHEDAKPIDEHSTSTTISESSTITVFDESATFVTIDEPSTSTTLVSESQPRMEQNEVLDEPLDLSMSAMSRTENRPQFQESVASSLSRRNKRKRKAIKLEYPATNENTFYKRVRAQNADDTHTEPPLPLALLTASQADLQSRNEPLNVTYNANTSYICYHCHIIFANKIMYAVHMSFHSPKNHLMCALCDRQSTNIVAFFLHLIRTKH